MKNDFEPMIPSEATARAVYRRADQLECRWQAAGLSPDFRDRMTDAVFRQLTRRNDLGERIGTGSSSERLACRMLEAFWVRNARRDCSRRVYKHIQLDESVADNNNRLDRIHDTIAIQQLTQLIVSSGVNREVAIAFVLSHLGLASQQVALLMGSVCKTRVTAATIRQWARRKFPAIKSRLRQHKDLLVRSPPSS